LPANSECRRGLRDYKTSITDQSRRWLELLRA
jgi:hypothetical protein